MNFGLETFRELIEDFLTNSGGRRGRQREQRRGELGDEFDDGGGTAETQTQDAEPSGSTSTADDDSEESDADDSGGGLFGRGSGASGDGDDIDDLYYRIEELEEELEDKTSKLGTVQDSQQQVADQIEEMNDRVRQLLGVYDQVTDDVNPFTGEGEEESGFGVFGEENMGSDGADDTTQRGAFGLEASGASADDDETVSFDDLKGVIEDAADARASSGRKITFDDDPDDTHVEVQATESVDGPTDSSETERPDEPAVDDSDDVTLTELADTYATDIIVFEWLTQLVRTAGSAATLRAISYYAEIGWINDDVKAHLEGVLSGPDLDIHVDPGTTPDELTAEDHADSYTYIMKLQEIHETKQEVNPDQPTESELGS